MLSIVEILKVVFLGIVEGVTEWLPISSTGHMLLVDEFIQIQASKGCSCCRRRRGCRRTA